MTPALCSSRATDNWCAFPATRESQRKGQTGDAHQHVHTCGPTTGLPRPAGHDRAQAASNVVKRHIQSCSRGARAACYDAGLDRSHCLKDENAGRENSQACDVYRQWTPEREQQSYYGEAGCDVGRKPHSEAVEKSSRERRDYDTQANRDTRTQETTITARPL